MTLNERIAKAQNNNNSAIKMYSVDGAKFQEYALSLVGSDKSYSGFIGQLVTAINNDKLTVAEATKQINAAIWANR